MMRSLYSGVSGLKTHQTKMDVIGNNIANVNTVGFKSSSVTFSDIMYQTTSGASGATANVGVRMQNRLVLVYSQQLFLQKLRVVLLRQPVILLI